MAHEMPFPAQRRIYRVSEIAQWIRATLENEVGEVWVEGEVSNFRRHVSGHVYFTLKDEQAQIAAAWFRNQQRPLNFQLRDGLQVRVYGRVTAYAPRSRYQVVVEQVEPAGWGALYEAFERLKKKLAAEGLFDAARKKPLPLLPQRIGIVTSPTGAALRDILKVLSRRFPNLHLVLSPTRVQGAGAAEEIAAAIDLLDRHGNVDVMIVGRGGGSLEDLWCFNEECVARAIARARTPVISAVGHEVDVTIADFVADVRAPTPSAAAEMVVGRKEEFERHVQQLARQLVRALETRALRWRQRLTAAAGSRLFREPAYLVRQYRERLGRLRGALATEPRRVVQLRQQRTDELELRFAHALQTRLAHWIHHVRQLEAQLRALAPQTVLERGYSITFRSDGAVVRSARDVRTGEKLTTRVARGLIESLVTSTRLRRLGAGRGQQPRREGHGGKEERAQL